MSILSYDMNSVTESLYIHWPFCPYKCHFCPFVAIAGQDHFMADYHKALVAEILLFAQKYSQKRVLETIFLGGGTPSTYPDDLLLDMSGKLKDVFPFGVLSEVTIEVNPGTVRDEQLNVWKQAGINRLSIGVQSLKDSVLHDLNRKQSKRDVFALLDKACVVFDNISIDLIIGLPNVSQAEWKELIATVVAWPINHISVYFLTVHEDTPLYFRVNTQKVALPPDDAIVDLYVWTINALADHGFEHYELSNFARSGFYSRHNSVYWDRKPYKGFGIGACSFDGKKRFQTEKNLLTYIKAINNGDEITIFEETLNPHQEHLERVMLGLRRKQGYRVNALCMLEDREHLQRFEQEIELMIAQSLVIRCDDYIALLPKGFAVHHGIVTKLSCKH